MRTIGKSQTIDARTGRVVSEGPGMMLLPPAADKCQECAVKHGPSEPHNAQSLFYQVAFQADHGRPPTWKDAIAHCPEPVRAAWEAELRQRGAWTEPVPVCIDPAEG